MKTSRLIGLIMIPASIMAMTMSCKTAQDTSVTVIDNGIKFCESTLPCNDGILIANFGTEELNPLNTEGKGYIVMWKDGETKTVVPADGNLSAPKGMFFKDNYLYICDVNKIAVYRMDDNGSVFVKDIVFPEGNLFVNDLAASGNSLYASVTNTDKIYRIDISDISNPGEAQEWLTVPGPNGLLVSGDGMYIASYPADGVTQEKHVIYKVADLNNPTLAKVIETPGQYDGIALSADNRMLYITNWTPAEISGIDLETGSVTPIAISIEKPLAGPADISLTGGKIYIPDLPNSRVVVIAEPESAR